MSIPDLYEFADPDVYYNSFDRIMSGEDIISESLIKRKDGTQIIVELSNRRIIVRESHFMHTIARDISELKKTEEKLKQSANELKELSRHDENLMET